MNRRTFLGSLFGVAGGLVLPEPPRVRAYSFMPGERDDFYPFAISREESDADLKRRIVERLNAPLERLGPATFNGYDFPGLGRVELSPDGKTLHVYPEAWAETIETTIGFRYSLDSGDTWTGAEI